MRQRRRIRNSTKPFVGRSTSMHFMLTGAPVFNTWCGIAGQLMLLPNGGPFVNLKHHSELVDSPASSQSNTPSKKESAILKMILASMTAGRPKEILQLPPIRYHEMRTSTQAEPFSIIGIEAWTTEGQHLLRYARHKSKRRLAFMGLAWLQKAQTEAKGSLLRIATNIADGLPADNMPSTKQIQPRRYLGALFKEDLKQLNSYIKGEIQEKRKR